MSWEKKKESSLWLSFSSSAVLHDSDCYSFNAADTSIEVRLVEVYLYGQEKEASEPNYESRE